MVRHEPGDDAASTTAPGIPPAGAILDGRFKIERLIGKGGMGFVLAAIHLELEQRVAIKLLSPDREQQERGASRLLREARASARIRSEHVVRVLDVVQRPERPPYIVLEYLEGEDLAHRLSRRGRLDAAEAVDIVLQACEAVGEGHRLGIVHRDLKPSNLFLCARPGQAATLKVLDFGISKMMEPGASLTQSYALLGSPIYAAPEQLRSSRDVDARADIWSLGIVLYECVTGARPFGGETLAQVCTSILHDPPRPPRAVEPRVPAALESVLLRCLRRDPAERYQSIEQFVGALHDFAPRAAERCAAYLDALPKNESAGTSSTAPRGLPRSEPSDTLTGSAEYDSRDGNSSVARLASERRRRAKLGVAFAIVAAAALGAWRVLHAWERNSKLEMALHAASAPTPNGRTSAPPLASASIPVPALTPAAAASSAQARAKSDAPTLAPSRTPSRSVSGSAPHPLNRTAGPRPPSSSNVQPIAPWVDTR